MRYKVKWRAPSHEPWQPEEFVIEEAAKARVRQLLTRYGNQATIDVWDSDETWQIVSSTGVESWSRS